MFLASLMVIILAQKIDPQQEKPAIQTYQFADTLVGKDYSIDSLNAMVGVDKEVPSGFEEAALIALSAYPQLRNVSIKMIMTQGGAPMESNFDLLTLFGPRQDRIYEILLNDAEGTFFDPILLRNLPFDAQIGILAHELGHVVYYHQLNTLQIAKWGLLYLFDGDFRATHEKSTDLMPVYHGLGSQIYQYARYVRYAPCCEEFYQQFGGFMDAYYLTDEEILDVMNDLKFKVDRSTKPNTTE